MAMFLWDGEPAQQNRIGVPAEPLIKRARLAIEPRRRPVPRPASEPAQKSKAAENEVGSINEPKFCLNVAF